VKAAALKRRPCSLVPPSTTEVWTRTRTPASSSSVEITMISSGWLFKQLKRQSENADSVSTVGMMTLASDDLYARSSGKGSVKERYSFLYLADIRISMKSQRLCTHQFIASQGRTTRRLTRRLPRQPERTGAGGLVVAPFERIEFRGRKNADVS
jgi:hypothetical protein